MAEDGIKGTAQQEETVKGPNGKIRHLPNGSSYGGESLWI